MAVARPQHQPDYGGLVVPATLHGVEDTTGSPQAVDQVARLQTPRRTYLRRAGTYLSTYDLSHITTNMSFPQSLKKPRKSAYLRVVLSDANQTM